MRSPDDNVRDGQVSPWQLDARLKGPLTIAYITHTAAWSGCNISLQLLLEALPPERVQSVVLMPAGPAVARFRAAGIETIVLPGISTFVNHIGAELRGIRLLTLLRSLAQLRHGRALRRALERLEPDIVHINELGMYQAARIARTLSIPVVMHARGVSPYDRPLASTVFDRLIERYVDTLIAIDGSVARSLSHHSPRVVYNCLDRRFMSAGRVEEQRPRHTIRVTYLTGLIHFKGIWDLLEAARILRGRNDVQFRIAGKNPRPDSFYTSIPGRISHALGLSRDEEREVVQFIAHNGLQDTVELLGQVDPFDILKSGTDILVFPSHLDGPGRSVYEAGALGVPSVVSMQHRVEDIVRDGVNGRIVRERDPRDLRAAIEELVDDAGRRRKLGMAAQAQYRAQFAPDASAAALLDVYEKVVHRIPPVTPSPC